MSRRHRNADLHEDMRAAFIGGITYACEALDLLMDQRARDSADLGATLAATIIRGDAAAIRKWLEQELAYELPQDGVPPM